MSMKHNAEALCMIFIESQKETIQTQDFLEWYDVTRRCGEKVKDAFGEEADVDWSITGLVVLFAVDNAENRSRLRSFLRDQLKDYYYTVLFTPQPVPEVLRSRMIRYGCLQYEREGRHPHFAEEIHEPDRIPQQDGDNQKLLKERMQSFIGFMEKGDFEAARIFFSQLHTAYRFGESGIHPRGLYALSMAVWIIQYGHFDDETAEFLATQIPNAVLGQTWYRFILTQIHRICDSNLYVQKSRFDTFEQRVHRKIDFEVTDPHLNLKRAADIFGLTPTYFSQQFKQHMGVGFLSYVEEKRMNIGFDLLKQRDMTVERAALSCGYENVGSFRRNFKKHFGINPGDLKQ